MPEGNRRCASTADGLDRYDGYTFQHHRHDRADSRSLTNDYVADIGLDSSGRLWAAAGTVWVGTARTSCSIGFACYPFIAEAPALSTWEDVLRKSGSRERS